MWCCQTLSNNNNHTAMVWILLLLLLLSKLTLIFVYKSEQNVDIIKKQEPKASANTCENCYS